MEKQNDNTSQPRLVRRLRNYLRQLDAHQRKREAATLISEAADEIERLQNACNKWSESETLHPLMHCPKCGELRGMNHPCDSLPNSHAQPDTDTMKNSTTPPANLDRLVLLLNEAYVFLGMPLKELHPWRIVLGEWQAKVEQETGWNHFAEVEKFKKNATAEAHQ